MLSNKFIFLAVILVLAIMWGNREGFCNYPVRRPWWHYTYPSWKRPVKWWPLFHWFNEKSPSSY